MSARKTFYLLLAVAVVAGIFLALYANTEIAAERLASTRAQTSNAYALTAFLRGGVGVSLILCAGFPLFFLVVSLAARGRRSATQRAPRQSSRSGEMA